MTERVKRVKQRVVTSTFPLCCERLRIAFDVLEANKGRPIIEVRSKIQEAILREMPIFIEPDDLIAGVGASKPNGIEMDYEVGPWTPDEVQALKDEVYVISPEDEDALYGYMERYQKGDLGITTAEALGSIAGESEILWPYLRSGLTLPPFKDKKAGAGGGKAQSGMGMGPGEIVTVVDFEMILKEGARSIIDRCKEQLKNHRYDTPDCIEKKRFWDAAIRIYEAWIAWANRYAELAEQMAAEESDPIRAQELRDMAVRCRHVPEYPARNFREAIQSFWFTYLMVVPSPVGSAGRFDQYLYPFYKADKDAGILTDDEALELIELIRLKNCQLNRINGKAGRLKNAGMAKWQNWTIGGVDQEGNDATNELTYMVLKAAMECKTPHHTITLRVNEKTPLEVIEAGVEVVKAGLGMPSFVSDKSYMNFLLSRGCSVEDARNFCVAGCVNHMIPGLLRHGPGSANFVIALVMDIFLHNGWCSSISEQVGLKTGDVRDFKTFDELKAAFYKQLEYLIDLAAQCTNLRILSTRDLVQNTWMSCLYRGGIEAGKDFLAREFEYDCCNGMSAVGAINAADSLSAIKELVFEQKKYSMAQLMDALDADWVGFEEMRKDFLAAPKYGNNDDRADEQLVELYHNYATFVHSHRNMNGGYFEPNGISISSHQPGGKIVGALPDGRKAGTILADGAMSASQGKDISGPLALFKSAMKVNADEFGALLMNMKFHPTALQTKEDTRKLAQALKVFLTSGGKQVQLNVVDSETLENAKANPESYRDLIVRVAGYSAYFTLLTKPIQNEVIARTAHQNV